MVIQIQYTDTGVPLTQKQISGIRDILSAFRHSNDDAERMTFIFTSQLKNAVWCRNYPELTELTPELFHKALTQGVRKIDADGKAPEIKPVKQSNPVEHLFVKQLIVPGGYLFKTEDSNIQPMIKRLNQLPNVINAFASEGWEYIEQNNDLLIFKRVARPDHSDIIIQQQQDQIKRLTEEVKRLRTLLNRGWVENE